MIASSSYFYHGHMRTMKAVMLKLFSGLNVVQKDRDGNVIKVIKSVPVTWAARDKAYRRKLFQAEDDGPLETKGHPVFPKMKVTMLDMRPAVQRITNAQRLPTMVDAAGNAVTLDPGVPYDFDFELSIAGKNAPDVEQLVEQILPHFRMTHIVSIKNLPYTNGGHVDVPVSLTQVTFEDDYDSPMEEGHRIVTCHISFTAQYSFVGPVGSPSEFTDNAAIDGSTPTSARGVVKTTIVDVYTDFSENFFDSTDSSLRVSSTKATPSSEQLDLFQRPPTGPRQS